MRARALSVAVLVPAFAIIAVINFHGFGKASRTLAQNPPATLSIDMVQDVGGTWCNPVDSSATHTPAGSYTVAVCLNNAPSAPWAFEFEFHYDNALNQCVPGVPIPIDDPGLDGNPDANAGSTVFSGTVPALNALGGGWSCNVGNVFPAVCNNASGFAHIQCNTVTGPAVLPTGPGVSEPIAVVRLSVLADGIDNLTLENARVFDVNIIAYVDCVEEPSGCVGATDTKNATPPPTPTNTFTPAPPTSTPVICDWPGNPTCTPTPKPWRTPTPTRHGVGGAVMLPPAAVAGASGASADGSNCTAAVYAALAGTVVAICIGGCYARKRRHAR